MKNATMLYRSPGPEVYEGVPCETVVVDEPEVDAHLAEGWSRNWIEAGEAVKEAAAKLAANEQQLAENEAKLAAAGADDLVGDDAADKPADATASKAKGRGKAAG